ncbi:Cof-type HAD-IIB family hydrolase [Aerococcus tenax]|uniref:Cof-type HAD-IIB family hydrolase n=1 Tax=Aerococcus tenax TaxID=3078812 RepID=UPI0018A70A39|nr:Cof-type HAD-IIB family hydrolase [Aerococcus tenax]
MYKGIVYLDLDGTLFDDECEVSHENREALKALHNNNYLPVVVTGRHISQISELLKDNKIDSYILNNGQLVVGKGNILSENVIEKEVVKRLKEFAINLDIELCYYGENTLAIEKESDLLKNCFDFFSVYNYKVYEEFYLDNDVLMMLALTENTSYDYQLKSNFPELNFYRTSPYLLDVIPKKASKGRAIKIFENQMNFLNLTTYAFGDSSNDLSMFEQVDYKIAMDNAISSLKDVSDLVVDNSRNTGVSKGLKHYQLI